MKNYEPKIKKDELITGTYYYGQCRNATVARWNGEFFVYWRYKFGNWILDEINCPENDTNFDVFVAERLATQKEIDELVKPIPMKAF